MRIITSRHRMSHVSCTERFRVYGFRFRVIISHHQSCTGEDVQKLDSPLTSLLPGLVLNDE